MLESPVSTLLTAGGGRLNDPVMFGCYQGGLLWGWSVRERNWERLIQSSIKTESSQYLPALGDIKSAAEPGRPMTDKPKVNTDCNGRGEGRGGKLYYIFWVWVPSQSSIHLWSSLIFAQNIRSSKQMQIVQTNFLLKSSNIWQAREGGNIEWYCYGTEEN